MAADVTGSYHNVIAYSHLLADGSTTGHITLYLIIVPIIPMDSNKDSTLLHLILF